MNDLIDYGVVQRGFMGVQIADINQEIKEENKLPNLKGVYVSKVTEGGGAEKGGLKDGEVILKIGNKEVNSVASLQEEIGKRRPGDKVILTVREKDGDEAIKEVVLRNSEGDTKLVSKEEVSKSAALGALFSELTSKELKEVKLEYGVKIKSLNSGKLAAAGLKEGYIITKVNSEPVVSVEKLTAKLNNYNGGILIEFVTPSGKRDWTGLGL